MKLTFEHEKGGKHIIEANEYSFKDFLWKICRVPKMYRLVECEGEGPMSDLIREQIQKRKELGDTYEIDYVALAKFVGHKSVRKSHNPEETSFSEDHTHES